MADFPDIPPGRGIPLVDLTTGLLAAPVQDALDARYPATTGAQVSALANGVAASNSAASNTAALNALHSAAASLGAVVVLPPGDIAVTAVTLLAPMIGASMEATRLVAADSVTFGASSIALGSLTIESSDATAIIASNKADLILRDVKVVFDVSVTTDHLAFDAYQIERLRVLNSRFSIGGVQMSGCADFLIDGNYWDCGYLNVNEPCHISQGSSGQFVNNTILETSTDGIDLYTAGEYCVVAGNRIIGCKGATGIEVKVSLSDDPGNSSGPGNTIDAVVIANNVLRDFIPPSVGTRSGISAAYIDNRAVPSFAVTDTNRALIIAGNIFEDFNVTNPGFAASYWGIEYTGHNGMIVNNVVRNIRAHTGSPIGIRLAYVATAKCVGVRVAGNVIAGIDGWMGISVGNLERCQIDDNIIRGDEVNATVTRMGVNVVTGATLTDCSISGNIFECNHATGMGIRTEASSNVLTRCRVENNTFKNCGATIHVAQDCQFIGNSLDNAANSQNFSVGTSGSSSRGNSYIANHFTMSSDYALGVVDHDGFVMSGNTFRSTNRAILLVGGTRKGIVTANLSINQSGGTELPYYSGVSAPDQATVTVANNLVTT